MPDDVHKMNKLLRRGDSLVLEQDGTELARMRYDGKVPRRQDTAQFFLTAPNGVYVRLEKRPSPKRAE